VGTCQVDFKSGSSGIGTLGEQNSISALAVATAHRLRLLQSGMAEEEAPQRTAAMAREIRDVLAKLVPEQRRQFLQQLEDHFPTFDHAASATRGPALPPEPPDPLSMVEELAALSPGLSAALRKSIIDRLSSAGLAAGGPASVPDQEQQELARLLQLPAGKKVDAARAFQLLTLLLEVAIKLDQAVWTSWAQIEPNSDLRRSVTLQRSVARFLTGDGPRQQVQQDGDRLLKLAAAMIVSLQKIGPGLFHSFFDPVSPGTIRDQVTEWSFVKGKEVRFWEKYEELTKRMDGGSFTAALHAAVAKVVRDYLPASAPAASSPAVVADASS